MRWPILILIYLGCFCNQVGFAQTTSTVLQQLDTFVAAATGKRVGMITNPSGCDEDGHPDVNYLMGRTNITAFFAPEHGIRGDISGGGGDYVDPVTGIPVYAVYGSRNAPTDSHMNLVDLLVFDMQDVGVRFYTFQWTMTYCMEAAARNGKPFYIIDRPNPIGGLRVEGAPNPTDNGVVGRLAAGAPFGVSTRTGMTVGEIGKLWDERWMSPGVDLHVILMPNWTRNQYWTDTGRVFVKPSPNMRSPATAIVYPGTCIFEGSNVSEGRGTTAPFEIIGAPFFNAATYAAQLNGSGLAGVQFQPMSFTPTTSNFSGQLCHGVQIVVLNRDTFDPIRMGLTMLKVAYQLYPTQVTISSYTSTLFGVPNLHNSIKTQTVDTIIAGWQSNLDQFKAIRTQYLLYPETVAAVDNWRDY